MIVYNVERGWFTEKAVAEGIRKDRGLKPAATLKIEIKDRGDLAALLNALCNPPAPGKSVQKPATTELVNRSYVDHRNVPDFIPKFLVREAEEREALHKRVKEQRG